MRRTGILSIGLGISRLGFRRLMKGALDNGGFRRATDFLEVDRGLNPGETIWADGTDATFGGDGVFVITDAGRPARAAATKRGANAATAAATAARAERSSGGRKDAKKSGAKKAGTKKSGAKKAGAKKSATKKSAAKKSAAKGAKKSGAKNSGGGRKSAKRASKKSTK